MTYDQPHGYGQPPAGQPTSEERTLATIAQASGPIAQIVSVGSLGWVPPLIIWIMKRDSSPFVRQHAAEALNLQITALIVVVVTFLGAVLTLGLGLIIVIPFWVVYGIFLVVVAIMAIVKALGGDTFRYPLTLHLVD